MTENRGFFCRRRKGGNTFLRRQLDNNVLSTFVRADFNHHPLITIHLSLLRHAPGAARTRNLQLRRLTLYPVELRALVRSVIIIGGQPITTVQPVALLLVLMLLLARIAVAEHNSRSSRA